MPNETVDGYTVRYSDYVERGTMITMHAQHAIIVRDHYDLLALRFWMTVRPALERLERETARAWLPTQLRVMAMGAGEPIYGALEQAFRSITPAMLLGASGPGVVSTDNVTFREVDPRLDDWPDYGTRLVDDVTAWWNLPWYVRAFKRLQRRLRREDSDR